MIWGLFFVLLGLALLVLEVFLPSGGFLFLCSVTAMVSGILMVFYAPPSEGGGVTAGLVTLIGLIVLLPVVLSVAFYYWPHTPFGKRLFLAQPKEETSVTTTMTEITELEQLRGMTGKTVTPHQPSGQTLINGRRHDSLSEGMFLEPGQLVKVVNIQAGQLVIRPVIAASETANLPSDLPSDLLG
jgi:membrane-bound serine protease (ClpP class)